MSSAGGGWRTTFFKTGILEKYLLADTDAEIHKFYYRPLVLDIEKLQGTLKQDEVF